MNLKKYSIAFTRSSKKEFLKLERKQQDKVEEALRFLSHNPYSDLLTVKKLKGEDSLYRIRIGDYRIVYTIENQQLVIVVIKIAHRREVYRKK